MGQMAAARVREIHTLRRKGATIRNIAKAVGCSLGAAVRHSKPVDDKIRQEVEAEDGGLQVDYLAVISEMLRQIACAACKKPVYYLASMAEVRCTNKACMHVQQLPGKRGRK